jgi:hypothetical protein
MKRLTGFYSLKNLSDTELKSFFTDAVMLSYNTYIDKLDANESWRRQNSNDKTIQEMIDNASVKNHNVCVDRSIQYDKTLYGEVGYSTLIDVPDYLLYCLLTLDNLKILTEKYNLIMK